MSQIAQIKWLIYRSIYLDIKLIANVPNIHLIKKLLFIINKYIAITQILVSKKQIRFIKESHFRVPFILMMNLQLGFYKVFIVIILGSSRIYQLILL